MTCLAVSDDYIAICRGNHIDCYNNSTHAYYSVPFKPGADEHDYISNLIISSDSKYLASITSSSKQLTICSLPFTEDVKSFTVPRSASKIKFTANNSQVLVADKSGDVLLYNINDAKSGTKLLGHLSLLLDVLQTNDEKYVISSDRDEKIRVSCFPNTYNIETYCLGHKEFVNHLEILPHKEKYLSSASGDGTVKFWDYVKGTLVYSINTHEDVDDAKLKQAFTQYMDGEGVDVAILPIVHFTATSLNEECSLLAVAVHSYNKILIYSVDTTNNQFIHKAEDKIEVEKFPAEIQLHKSSLFLYDDEEATVTVMKLVNIENKISFIFDKKIKMFDTMSIKFEAKPCIETIKVLYKRKFDNVLEYQQRKKQRLEKKSQ